MKVLGTGSCLPETVLTNEELFQLPGIRTVFDAEHARASLRGVEDPSTLTEAEVFDRWAVQISGIRERRILSGDSGLTTEDLCATAAVRALEMADLEADAIDHIVVATITGSDEMPNPGCTIGNKIGAPSASAYTLNAACAGFAFAMAQAWASIRSGMVGTTLVVGGDVMSRITSYADPTTAVLFGDGAGAAILGAGRGRMILGRPALGGSYARDPLWLVGQGWESSDEPDPKLHMMGGPSILRRAVNHMARMGAEALESSGRSWDDVDIVIPHQANERITSALSKKLNLDRGRIISTIAHYGNLSAGTVSVALDETLRGRRGPLPDQGTLVLTAVGGGYATGAIAVDLSEE